MVMGIDDWIRKSRKEVDDAQDIICMEFLKRGDLIKSMIKMARKNRDDPDSIFSEEEAWTIFECLWRGCVALAHPQGFYQGQDPLTTQILQSPSQVRGLQQVVVIPTFTLIWILKTVRSLLQSCFTIGVRLGLSNNPSIFLLAVFVGDFDTDHVLWPLTKTFDMALLLLNSFRAMNS
jgi:hypothetical protein